MSPELIAQLKQEFLTPGEVAALFRVDPKTVTRWASAGRLDSFKTPGGHRRFSRQAVLDLVESLREDRKDAEQV